MNLQLSAPRYTDRLPLPTPTATAAPASTATRQRQALRRHLQLGLAALWLLDAALQFQPYMFSRSFATDIIGSTAAGNPGLVAWPITLSAGLVGDHPVFYNSVFASIQLLIAVGIAVGVARPSIAKLALGVSVGWSLGVWWVGEGWGGILTGGTTVYMGAPGAAVLYALIAIMVWPRTPDVMPGSSLAATSPLGRFVPTLAWVALWSSFVYYALVPAMRAPQSLSAMMSGMAGGEPGWIKAMDGSLGRALAGHGTEVSIVLAAAFALAGVAAVVPRAARVGVLVAVVAGALLWVAEDFGGIFTGSATDPNTGLPLMVLAACYWPVSGDRHGGGVLAGIATRCVRIASWSPASDPATKIPPPADRWASPDVSSATPGGSLSSQELVSPPTAASPTSGGPTGCGPVTRRRKRLPTLANT